MSHDVTDQQCMYVMEMAMAAAPNDFDAGRALRSSRAGGGTRFVPHPRPAAPALIVRAAAQLLPRPASSSSSLVGGRAGCGPLSSPGLALQGRRLLSPPPFRMFVFAWFRLLCCCGVVRSSSASIGLFGCMVPRNHMGTWGHMLGCLLARCPADWSPCVASAAEAVHL